MNFPPMSLQNIALSEACLNILEYKFVQKQRCLVFHIDENNLHIATDSDDISMGLVRTHILQLYPKVHLSFFSTSSEDFHLQAHQIYLFQHFNNLKNALLTQHTSPAHNQEDMREKDISVVALLDFILQVCIEQKASDIHFESFEHNAQSKARIRIRIDGMLREIFSLESYVLEALSSRLKLECKLDITQKRQSQDGRFSREFHGISYDFRLSILPAFGGESLVIRILCKNTQSISLQSLGFKPEHLAIITHHIHIPNGIILLTGPTGSGKSTTLYAMLESIKSPDKKIITLEDPIEYHTELTTQVLINDKYNFGFSQALRALLRHDPDVLMIGEIRDKDSLDIALRASLTGHLVLSTLHANDSLSVVERLLDMGAQNYLLTSSLRLIVSQRLVRKLCEYCKTPIDSQNIYQKLLYAKLEYLWEDIKDGTFFAPCGCVHCNMQGFSGRILCSELLEGSNLLYEYIKSPNDKSHTYHLLKKSGFKSMLEEGMSILKNGQSSFEEIYRVCNI
ncbi:GspE/PulE family protein [Helicobacter marmotae]|uniref:Type II/IV secretion system protein n=1 Tax=Helicobacter marmotae TaxID=152490 RepID=A0A3D8I2T0_9HELI|nr:GspE/PulE family protein [Helicobacter marmotae]RDU59463.1 type II/IV secretion system protein [Helicobacter marmotae]